MFLFCCNATSAQPMLLSCCAGAWRACVRARVCVVYACELFSFAVSEGVNAFSPPPRSPCRSEKLYNEVLIAKLCRFPARVQLRGFVQECACQAVFSHMHTHTRTHVHICTRTHTHRHTHRHRHLRKRTKGLACQAHEFLQLCTQALVDGGERICAVRFKEPLHRCCKVRLQIHAEHGVTCINLQISSNSRV